VSVETRVYADIKQLSREAARQVAGLINTAVTRNGRCSIALAGGTTPRTLYAVLAEDHAGDVPWPRVHLFWGDERYVPFEHPSSNYRMVDKALLRHVPISPENVHPMPTSFESQEDAANSYETTLRQYFAGLAGSTESTGQQTLFDLVLLGIGRDGHTASLFPGSPVLDEQENWVRAVKTPADQADPPQRLTLTFPAINAAANIYVLAAGAAKAEAVRCALGDQPDPQDCPVAGVRPRSGNITWWLDRAAARLVSGTRGRE